MCTIFKMKNKIVTVVCLILNVLLSMGLVLLNKWLYVHTGFPNITLSMIQFFGTFIGLIICDIMDVFCVKNIEIRAVLTISVPFCAFVVLTNLSLAQNTVGTYQIAKMLTIPCVVLMQMFFYNKQFSKSVILPLIPIVVGVVIYFYYDMQFNILGIIYATMEVLVTSLYQVLVNRKQRELQMDTMQLLYYQAPLSAIILFSVIPLLEPWGQTFTRRWSSLDIIMVILSSVVVLLVNLTSYWIIGKTSPLIFNMVGHSKFFLLLLGGAVVFNETLTVNQAIGIILTMIGILLYVHVTIKKNVNRGRISKPLHKI